MKSADEMDADTFLKHVNARHVPIAKMAKVGKSRVPGDSDEHLLRAYHERLHEIFDDGFTSEYATERVPDHVHVAPSPEPEEKATP